LQSLSNNSDSFPAASLNPDGPTQAASIPAADLSDAASGSASWLPKAGSRSGMAQQESQKAALLLSHTQILSQRLHCQVH